ncbi:MAG: Smr/MutS family protein [Desulfobacterales bacterium]
MKSSGAFKPFRHLKSLFQEKEIPLESGPALQAPDIDGDGMDDRTLFFKAMEGVTPLRRRHDRLSGLRGSRPSPGKRAYASEEQQVLERLRALIGDGTGFSWAQTDEYIEGTDDRLHPEIARRLHQGHFTVQDQIDLHGLTVREAKTALDQFLRRAVRTRKNAVMVIHGRGLSSRGEPVLKAGVVKWLTSSPWRKWVAAFASARACDGGPGATYVLLRPNPLQRRRRRSGKKY